MGKAISWIGTLPFTRTFRSIVFFIALSNTYYPLIRKNWWQQKSIQYDRTASPRMSLSSWVLYSHALGKYTEDIQIDKIKSILNFSNTTCIFPSFREVYNVRESTKKFTTILQNFSVISCSVSLWNGDLCSLSLTNRYQRKQSTEPMEISGMKYSPLLYDCRLHQWWSFPSKVNMNRHSLSPLAIVVGLSNRMPRFFLFISFPQSVSQSQNNLVYSGTPFLWKKSKYPHRFTTDV